MKRLMSATIICLAIAVSGCSRDEGSDVATGNADQASQNASTEPGSLPMNTSRASALPAAEFATAIAGSDMYEIEAGKLAQAKATDAALKDFGGMLVTQHGKSSADLKSAAAGSVPAVALPTSLPAEHKGHIDTLKAANGAEFDRLFKQQQIEGHRKALETLRSYAEAGDSPSLKAFASSAQDVVQRHLDQLNAMPR